MRDEGVRIAEAVDEALAIGAQAGCPVQISHLKISSLDRWGRAPEILAAIAGARARGVRVTCDQYPYHASSGGLRHHLPAWVHEGGLPALLGRIREPATRARLRYDLVEGMAKAGVSMRFYRWDLTRVSESPTRPEYAGLTLAEIGAREGKAPVDALLDLLLADGGRTGGIYFHISEDDVRTIMRDPHVGVGSDGLYTGRPGQPGRGRPHPRHFGTFPRVLGRYVRDEGVLALPEAVRKMTSLSADALGLEDRGRIRVGAAADLVVFDPATVARPRHVRDAPRGPRRASARSSSTACPSSSTASRPAPRPGASSGAASPTASPADPPLPRAARPGTTHSIMAATLARSAGPPSRESSRASSRVSGPALRAESREADGEAGARPPCPPPARAAP